MNNNKLLDEEIFFKVIKILNEANIIWWIDHGTLLGYIRDNQPIEWDRDFDIGTLVSLEHLTEHLLPKIKDQFSNAYIDILADSLKIQLISKCNHPWSIDIACYTIAKNQAIKYWPDFKKTNFLQSKLAKSILILNGSNPKQKKSLQIRFFIKILQFIRKFFRSITNETKRASILRKLKPLLPYKINSVNSKYFKGTNTIKVKGNYLNIPLMHEKYLEERYGKNWRTPIKKWDYLTDDGGVKKFQKHDTNTQT